MASTRKSGHGPLASARAAVKDQSPLRGAPLVPRYASLTAPSLRLLSFYGGAGAPPVQKQSFKNPEVRE
jgi:hypothetical protein